LRTLHPNTPYLCLWARLSEFHKDALTRLLEERRVVRSSVLRSTQHTVSRQALALDVLARGSPAPG
jgi:hypothetical protein